jgi:uncharacterized membrane protein
MTTTKHLWAIGFDDVTRADQVRDEILRIGQDRGELIVKDVVVVVRHPDGSLTIDRQSLDTLNYFLHCTAVGFLAGVAVYAPLTGAIVGAVMGGADVAASAALGIHNDFIREVEGLLKPGTSALFVLDVPKNLDMILDKIRGLGGTVLKTSVDVDRAKLIQSTLSAGAGGTNKPDSP